MYRTDCGKNLAEWLKRDSHLTVLVLILAAVVAWDYRSLHPTLELDMGGPWEARACSSDGKECDSWTQVQVPGHFSPAFDREKQWQRVQFKRSFATPIVCETQTCKLVFAEVGDSLDGTLNGLELRHVHEKRAGDYYEKNYAISLDLPSCLLAPAGSLNHFVADVKSLKRDQTGIRTAPVGIVKQIDGQRFIHGKTFRSLYLPLVGAVLTSLCLLLLKAVSRALASSPLLNLFETYAVTSALFLVSFSELPRSLIPIEIAVPLHFLLRLAADGALLVLLGHSLAPSRLLRAMRRTYGLALLVFVSLIICGIGACLGGLDVDVASTTYDYVRILNPLCATTFFVLAALFCLHRKWPLALASWAVWGVIIHDYMVGSGYLQAEFLSKYHHACIALGYSLIIAGKAGRQREAERLQLNAEREVAELARQVEHDVQSPLEALRVALRLQEGMPGDVHTLMKDATQRIDDVIKTMRTDAAKLVFGVEENEQIDLYSMLAAGMAEVKTRQLRKPIAWLENFSSARGCLVRVDACEFRRVLSNILNNATEALREGKNGCICVTGEAIGANHFRIIIADDGTGIPDSVLASLGRRGLTVGKKNGKGLGLSHAWHSMKTWRGELTCRKPECGGTEIVLDLPCTSARSKRNGVDRNRRTV